MTAMKMKWKFECILTRRGYGGLALISALALIAMVAAIPPAEAQLYKVIHRFTGGKDGIEPEAGVVIAADGTVYGTTYRGGGSSDTGTLFKIDPTHKETVISFPGCCGVYPKGGGPDGDLAHDAAGNL